MSGSCQRIRIPMSFAALTISRNSNNQHNDHDHVGSPNTTGNGNRRRSGFADPQHCHRARASAANRSAKAHNVSADRAKDGDQQQQQYRLIMMGSERVGKTSIVSQFLYDKYTPRYRRTTEDLHRGEYELADGASLTLDILDTCGAMEFPAMRRLSIQYGDAFVLVFAIDDISTWNEVEDLRNVILENRGPSVPMIVVGNKCDVDDAQRQITREYAEQIVRNEWRCGYVECSAKENIEIVEVFKALLRQAKITYNLSPAVRRRRMSLPASTVGGGSSVSSPAASAKFGGAKMLAAASGKYSMKRHSCTVA